MCCREIGEAIIKEVLDVAAAVAPAVVVVVAALAVAAAAAAVAIGEVLVVETGEHRATTSKVGRSRITHSKVGKVKLDFCIIFSEGLYHILQVFHMIQTYSFE